MTLSTTVPASSGSLEHSAAAAGRAATARERERGRALLCAFVAARDRGVHARRARGRAASTAAAATHAADLLDRHGTGR